MSGKKEFIECIKNANLQLTEAAQKYFESLCEEKEKPILTDNGKLILKGLQKMNTDNLKAKDIAEELFVSARMVAGAIRKLVTDGFVDKVGSEPCRYSLTEKGKNFIIED